MLQKFKSLFKTTTYLLFLIVITSCSQSTADHWSDLVPQSTLAVVVPEPNTSLQELLEAQYMPLLDDISPSAIQMVSNIQQNSGTPSLNVDALLLYPDTSNDWQPVWITGHKVGLIDHLTSLYQRAFEQNRYDFLDYSIEKLFFSDRIIHIVEIDDYIVFSESSLAIENILRTLNNEEEPMQLDSSQLIPGSVIMNYPSMDIWVRQMTQVLYRPFLHDIFRGSSPVTFQNNPSETNEWDWQLSGSMSLKKDKSVLLQAISQQPQNFILDRFIPANASAFSIIRSEPVFELSDDIIITHELDQFLERNSAAVQTLQQNLATEISHVAFADSGPSSESEFIFIRSIRNSQPIIDLFDELSERELTVKDENTYAVNSIIISKLIGTEMNTIDNFYLTIYDQIVVLALRKGLAESIGGDAERRRVMYYDDDYSKVRSSLNGPLSSIFYMDAAGFNRFVQPWLFPQNYLNTLTGNLDEFVISTRLLTNGSELEISMTNFERELTERPFQDQWVFPIDGSDITDIPVVEDVTGSLRNEIVFSTLSGEVYILASDGTLVVQMSTNDDRPIGSPVVYDWYGNNQNVILQAAGDKVYAWNQNGTLLPNFPVILNEEITSPLTIMDFTGNGVAEMILATADRNVHILNARGQAINGWPQTTNSVVRSAPLITDVDNIQSLFVFAENALHGWNMNGLRRTGFPLFLPAQIDGVPTKYNNHLLGAGLDGNLYSIGTTPLFSDSLSASHSADSIYVQSLIISNSSLNTSPQSFDILIREDNSGSLVRNEFILIQSTNGSLFLYADNGELKFTQALGQPSSGNYPPTILDINNDNRQDLIALADYGRLYAWDVLSGDRHQDLPTTGMNYPVILDINGDGFQEIIAQTRNGIQCWTIYFTRRESITEQ